VTTRTTGTTGATGTTALLPPAVVATAEGRWRVRRAWPADRRGVPVELEAEPAPDGTTGTGTVRAGWWRPDGVTVLPPGRDRRLPSLERVRGEVVSHRPGKRAVVRTADGHHVKVVRVGRAAEILAGIARAGALATTFRMPAVAAADDATVRFATLPGRSLHDAGAAGSDLTNDEWQQAWRQVLAAHTAAATAPPPPVPSPPSLVVHDATAEAAVLRRWADHWTGPDAPDWATELGWAVDRVTDELLTGRPGPLRVIHRDLHDKQLLWDPADGPGLLDVDTACLGEAALDLGNLRAHARWRRRQGVWTADRAATVLDAVDRTAAATDVVERTAAHERATLLRIACVHAFRPADRPHVGALVADAVRPLR